MRSPPGSRGERICTRRVVEAGPSRQPASTHPTRRDGGHFGHVASPLASGGRPTRRRQHITTSASRGCGALPAATAALTSAAAASTAVASEARVAEQPPLDASLHFGPLPISGCSVVQCCRRVCDHRRLPASGSRGWSARRGRSPIAAVVHAVTLALAAVNAAAAAVAPPPRAPPVPPTLLASQPSLPDSAPLWPPLSPGEAEYVEDAETLQRRIAQTVATQMPLTLTLAPAVFAVSEMHVAHTNISLRAGASVATLDAQNASRVFRVRLKGRLELWSVRLINGAVGREMRDTEPYALVGGAVMVQGDGSFLRIGSCEIHGCSASAGALQGSGGAVAVVDSAFAQLQNVQISSCFAGSYGGGVLFGDGGAGWLHDVTIEGCATGAEQLIRDANASASTLSEGGEDANASASAPSEGGKRGGGGGVAAVTNAFATLTACRIIACTAEYGGGGGVCVNSVLRFLDGCLVARCEAFFGLGGAVLASSLDWRNLAEFEASELLVELCESLQGAVAALNCRVSLTAFNITRCNAALDGGGLYSEGAPQSEIIAADGRISHCVSGLDGGGCAIKVPTAQLERVTFISCSAGDNAGGLLVDSEATCYLVDVDFFDCNSATRGGALSILVRSLYMLRGSIINCTSLLEHGGGLHMTGGSQANFTSVTISRCGARAELGLGGGIFQTSGVLHLNDCVLAECAAAASGGAIYLQRGEARLTSCTIRSCFASVGGGLEMLAGTVLEAYSTRIEGCIASAAGAAGHLVSGAVTMSDCLITRCGVEPAVGPSIDPQGGGFACIGGSVSLLNSIISHCYVVEGWFSSSAGGGGVWSASAEVELIGVLLRNNSAPRGSALYLASRTSVAGLHAALLTIDPVCQPVSFARTLIAAEQTAFIGPLPVPTPHSEFAAISAAGISILFPPPTCPASAAQLASALEVRFVLCGESASSCAELASCNNTEVIRGLAEVQTASCECAPPTYPSRFALWQRLAPYQKSGCVTAREAVGPRSDVTLFRLRKALSAPDLGVGSRVITLSMVGTDVARANWSVVNSSVPSWLQVEPAAGTIAEDEDVALLQLTAYVAGLPETVLPLEAFVLFDTVSQVSGHIVHPVLLYVQAKINASLSIWGRSQTDSGQCDPHPNTLLPVPAEPADVVRLEFTACDDNGIRVAHTLPDASDPREFDCKVVPEGPVSGSCSVSYGSLGEHVVTVQVGASGDYSVVLVIRYVGVVTDTSVAPEIVGDERKLLVRCPESTIPFPDAIGCGCDDDHYLSDSGLCVDCGFGFYSDALSDNASCHVEAWFIVMILLPCLFCVGCSWCLLQRYKRWLKRKMTAAAAAQQLLKAKLERISSVADRLQQLSFPMYVVDLRSFRGFGRLVSHEAALKHGGMLVLHTWKEATAFAAVSPIMFISHQWLSTTVPDPHNVHFPAIVAAATAIASSQSLDESELYIWLDFHSIPQLNKFQQKVAISCIAVYVACAKFFVVCAPQTTHATTLRPCDAGSYQQRGWCRLEQWAHIALVGMQRMFLYAAADGVDGQLEDLSLKLDWYKNAIDVYKGDFAVATDKEHLVDVVLGLYAYSIVCGKHVGDERFFTLLEQEDIFPSEYFSDMVELLELHLELARRGEPCAIEPQVFATILKARKIYYEIHDLAMPAELSQIRRRYVHIDDGARTRGDSQDEQGKRRESARSSLPNSIGVLLGRNPSHPNRERTATSYALADSSNENGTQLAAGRDHVPGASFPQPSLTVACHD